MAGLPGGLPRPCAARVNRSCLGKCGRTIPKGSRCGPCETARKGTPAQRGYNAAWTALSKRMRAEHVERYGYWCPGWQAEAHPSRDLVLDHGDPETGPQVMCRGCNSRKAALWDAKQRGPHGGDRPLPEYL
jgi:hypothetical protein